MTTPPHSLRLTRTPPPYILDCADGADRSFLTWQQEVLEDGSIVCGIRLVKPCGDAGWETCMTELKRFVRWVRTHGVCFQLLLEVTDGGSITLDQVRTFTDFMKRKRMMLVDHYKGTTVLLHSHAVEMVVVAAMIAVPPVKPFETLVVDTGTTGGGTTDAFGMPPALRKRVMDRFLGLQWPDDPGGSGRESVR